ncbi:hypothetical protein PsorP6_012247 [Peronosclerospora sorghi]|uniref:Uncharacterized protein n=1 Tax=Peronosclerospora sorghi TaxID=230839 RepID=A0ACC0WLY7_9STRA|nr:hypothetical protein PsorP6_012247 [Peronosclerospora sorghi]
MSQVTRGTMDHYKYVIVVTNGEGAILSPRQHKAVCLTVQHLGTQCSSCQEHFFATKWSKLFRKIASKRKMIACEAADLMYLQAEFGKYGKIMWSRSEEERARGVGEDACNPGAGVGRANALSSSAAQSPGFGERNMLPLEPNGFSVSEKNPKQIGGKYTHIVTECYTRGRMRNVSDRPEFRRRYTQ